MVGTMPSQTQNSPEHVINWTHFGVSREWVKYHFIPALVVEDHHFEFLSPPEHFDEISENANDYDLIVLGVDADDPMATLPEQVETLFHQHPSTIVLPFIAQPSDKDRVALMEAGATGVLEHRSTDEKIGKLLHRALERHNAFTRQIEDEKLRVISQLAVSVNHEINNPLTGLLGTAELLLMENSGELTDRVVKDLKLIINQCNRIREITTRLRNLNHLRTVSYGVHDQMIDLAGPIVTPAIKTSPAPKNATLFDRSHILVVDDNPLIVDLITRLFEDLYAIDAAGGAEDALAMLERHSYDLVLVDLILPGMNGLELFHEIRKMNSKQKVMLTTAHTGDPRIAQAQTEGALGCINKPFKLEELSESLSKALEREPVHH